MLGAELADFVESGVSVLVGTRDARLRPTCMRGMGALVDRATGRITLLLPEGVAAETLANMRDNGLVAVTFSRPIDHRSFQTKGKVVEIRPLTDAEREAQERYRPAFSEQLYAVGVPRGVSKRIRTSPSVAVVFEPNEMYEQTPGPRAGTVLS